MKIEDSVIEKISIGVNRSIAQVKHLLNLCSSMEEYLKLEEQMKNTFLFYCPDNREQVKTILEMVCKAIYFSIDVETFKFFDNFQSRNWNAYYIVL